MLKMEPRVWDGDGDKLYLSAIFDLKDKEIVAYAIARNNNNQLAFNTFNAAIQKHPNANPLFHNNRGYQLNKAFNDKLDLADMTQSMSRVGQCIDNGLMEAFWAH